jgi:hypothetical protein
MQRTTRRYRLPSALRPIPVRLGPQAARRLVAAGALLVDVRQDSGSTDVLRGAARIPPEEIPGRLGAFSRVTPIVLACT